MTVQGAMPETVMVQSAPHASATLQPITRMVATKPIGDILHTAQ
ncbi:MAG: hypothetical protein AB7F94_03785 [Nitrospira sp.]